MTKKNISQYEIETQRRFLKFINDAQSPHDLTIPIKALEKKILRERRPRVESYDEDVAVQLMMDEKSAKKIIDARNEMSPVYGFLNIKQMLDIPNLEFNNGWQGWICRFFGVARFGSWQQLNYQSTVKVAQAALVHTPDDNHKGRVILIEQVFGNTLHEEDYGRTGNPPFQ